jgi:hypothetical protein
MAMPPSVQVFRRSFAGYRFFSLWGENHHLTFGKITLHPPFVEPGVGNPSTLQAIGGEG